MGIFKSKEKSQILVNFDSFQDDFSMKTLLSDSKIRKKNKEILIKNYFNAIEKYQYHLARKNKSSEINRFLTFEEVGFNTKKNIKKSRHFKSHSNYLECILQEMEKLPNLKFVNNVKNTIKTTLNSFEYEPYLSNFFFVEYYLKSSPKFVQEIEGFIFQSNKSTFKEEMDDVFGLIYRIESNSTSKKVSIHSKINQINKEDNKQVEKINAKKIKEREKKVFYEIEMTLSKSIKSNFGDSLPQTPKSEENSIGKEYNNKRKTIKEYIKYFKYFIEEKQTSVGLINRDNHHPILVILRIFSKEVTQYIKSKEYEFRKNDLEQLIKIIQDFLITVQKGLKLMYSKTIDFSPFVEERDEFMNLICYFLFQDANFSFALREVYKKGFLFEIDHLGYIMEHLQEKPAEFFGVNQMYSLDDKTNEYMIKLIDKEIKNNPDKKDELLRLKEKLKKKLQNKNSLFIGDSDLNDSQKINFTLNIDSFRPTVDFSYYDAARVFYNVKHIVSPFQKMLLIALISEEIEKCVDEFYEELFSLIEIKDFQGIDPDQLMGIFLYLLIRANNPEILVDLKIIDDFTTDKAKGALTGYYFSTLSAAVHHLQTNEEYIKAAMKEDE